MAHVKNELADLVKIAEVNLEGVVVLPHSAELESAVAERASELRKAYVEPRDAADLLAPARDLYHRLGIDPSKRRPSSEALLRRILQGKGLYTVNTAVDAANLASLSFMLPVGLYDADKIESPTGLVTLRRGHPGEFYEGIGKGDIHVEDRPTLADDIGAFGNPSSDSLRTSVTPETTSLFFVIYAPVGLADEELESYRRESEGGLVRFIGGRAS